MGWRTRRVSWLLAVVAMTVPAAGAQQADGEAEPPRRDRRTGLVMAEGFEVIVRECTYCHSASFIRQNRGRREDWLGMIRWMQETQELRLFEPETEATILDYLSENYGTAERRFRRTPLAEELLPPPSRTRPRSLLP